MEFLMSFQMQSTLVLSIVLGIFMQFILLLSWHSCRCCHLAGELIRNLQQKQPELGITDAEVLCVQVAALCHDLGMSSYIVYAYNAIYGT